MAFPQHDLQLARARLFTRPARTLWLGLGLGLTGLVAWPTPAGAQERDAPTADVLFDRGLEELKNERYDAACPLFAESFKLDPRPGVTFTLAECEAKRGKVASASAYYQEYLRLFDQLPRAQQAKQYGREKISKKKIEDLAPKLPHLTVEVPDSLPRTVEVKRDGQPLGTPTWNVALPVDPGEHVVASRLPGGEWGEQRVTLAEGDKTSVAVAPPPPKAARPVIAQAPAPPPPAPLVVEQRPSKAPFVVATAIVGGLGLASGAIFGGVALASRGTAREHCNGPACDAEGKRAGNRAKTFATASTVATVIGVAGVGASLTIHFMSPAPTTTRGKSRGAPITASISWGAPGPLSR